MSEDIRLSKVEILIQQKKFADAEKILKELLSNEPNNIYYQSLLAEIFIQQDQFEKANQLIDNCISLHPDAAFLFHMKARISMQEENMNEAENHLDTAISLDPHEADFFALKAHIRLLRKKYSEALELANTALELDPENLLALNTRSTSLLKLNKKEESFETIQGALREDPNNAYTHTNYGWGLLEQGEHKKALEHFKEALKNDPNYEYAQAGMLEAIKANNPIYRLFLQYGFWMGNLTAKYQWAVIIGFTFGLRILRTLARKVEALQPFLVPIIIILSLIAFSTWVIRPISNLFLRFNRYGKFLLSNKEKMSSNLVAISFGILISGVLLSIFTDNQLFMTLTVFGFAMSVPCSVVFSPSKNNLLPIYTILMASIGVISIAKTFATGELVHGLSFVFILGFVLFQWVANYFLIKEDNY